MAWIKRMRFLFASAALSWPLWVLYGAPSLSCCLACYSDLCFPAEWAVLFFTTLPSWFTLFCLCFPSCILLLLDQNSNLQVVWVSSSLLIQFISCHYLILITTPRAVLSAFHHVNHLGMTICLCFKDADEWNMPQRLCIRLWITTVVFFNGIQEAVSFVYTPLDCVCHPLSVVVFVIQCFWGWNYILLPALIGKLAFTLQKKTLNLNLCATARRCMFPVYVAHKNM